MQNRPWRLHNYSSRYFLYESLAAGGEPSTRFPPEGLIETAADMKRCEQSRNTIVTLDSCGKPHSCAKSTGAHAGTSASQGTKHIGIA